MRFALAASGSRGNATIIQAGNTTIMVDCGLTLKDCEYRLQRLGLTFENIDALLITHEHSDHIAGAARLSQRCGFLPWASAGTRDAGRRKRLPDATQVFDSHAVFAIGDIEITPVIVPHDAAEPTQFVFSDGDKRIAVVTDLGHSTPYLEQVLGGVHGLVLESNHDEQMLASGPYPARLKRRVAGEYGHLSNEQAAALLSRIDTSRLQRLALAHLSEQNNTPQLARDGAVQALGCESEWIGIAGQDTGLEWQTL